MKLVIFVYLTLAYLFVLISNKEDTDNQKYIQCEVCQLMFVIDFDYDKLLKDALIIKNLKNKINIRKKAVIGDENLESIVKEISMQYFFKGGDSQFEGLTFYKIDFKSCKRETPTVNCEKLKKKLCENILSMDEGTCLKDQNNMDEPEPTNIKVSDKINKNEISFVELTPEYVNQNFDSIPKSHWKPPKPVILSNFENNMGDQLKEISLLTSEIAKLETKLKLLKQQLANKLEVAQSSYTVIQKTLQQISSMVNKPYLPDVIKSPSQYTEDDWDETSKPKFLN